MQIYQVGGSVRDKILNRPCHDQDHVVIGATEEEMLHQGYKKVGKSFPVFLHPQTKEEYALARKEIKTGSGHCDFKFIFTPDITLEEDSLRRDFTCNALYLNLETGEVIDYHNGIADTKNHILRHVSEHFSEDPLRVLRMCRFAATLDFTVAPETMDLCKKMVRDGALKHLSANRIWQELEKALGSKYFYRFIETAKECGALKELLPEVNALWQIPERTDYHPEGNSGAHTMLAIKAAQSSDSKVNFAIMLHDIGKTLTDPNFWPSHHNHDKLGAELIRKICRRLKAPTSYTDFAVFTAQNHMIYHHLNTKAIRKLTDIAITIANQKENNCYERFVEVLKGDMQGRQKKDFSTELEEFAKFELSLKKLVETASQNAISTMPNFNEILEKVQNKTILKDTLRQAYIDFIISKSS